MAEDTRPCPVLAYIKGTFPGLTSLLIEAHLPEGFSSAPDDGDGGWSQAALLKRMMDEAAQLARLEGSLDIEYALHLPASGGLALCSTRDTHAESAQGVDNDIVWEIWGRHGKRWISMTPAPVEPELDLQATLVSQTCAQIRKGGLQL